MATRLILVCSVALVSALLGYLYSDSIAFLFGYWIGSDDYSHGLFVPAIAALLIWQARDRLSAAEVSGAWWGTLILLLGILFYWIGESATLYLFLHLSLWIVIVGLVVSFIGVAKAKTIAFPLLYLLTAIPLPVFLHASLSSRLQLLSSTLGVGFLQSIGVTAFREGNVIDVGPVQLQVVEACSGIRYLLPLTSLALLCAYLFKDAMWKRVVIVISSVPISVLINGFRIGVIGVLVEWFGPGAAEGFSHLFEGWVLFMTSLGLIVLEMWLLAGRATFFDRFTWRDPSPSQPPTSILQPSASSLILPPAYLCTAALLVPFALASSLVGQGEESVPPRASFVDFPMQLQDWQGTAYPLEKQYVDELRFDDYVLADYHSLDGQPINLYAVYYRSQRKGQSAHSPQSCLPGGGWEISSLQRLDLPSAAPAGGPLRVNRALIQKDSQKQVILYWFKQRERILADEYLVKWYLLWDAVSRKRTDGALVRIASVIGPGENEAVVERRIRAFASAVEPELSRYVPD
jgi:exosortase D (VPLPA-CTERM-specific)